MTPTNKIVLNAGLFCSAIAASLTAAGNAKAATPVSYKFSATVTGVDTPLVSKFHVGDIISGRFKLTPLTPDPNLAWYDITDFSANIGGQYPITMSRGDFHISNNYGGSLDGVSLNLYDPIAPAVSGHIPDYFNWILAYTSSNALSSTNLLPQFIFAPLSDQSNLRFDGNDSIEVRYKLTDFSLVPEPSTATLAVIAGGFLLRRVRRGVRQTTD